MPNLYAVAQQNCLQAPDTRTTVMGQRSGSSPSNDDVERAAPKALPLYANLGQFALTTLVPGGWLLCLTGWGLDLDIRQGWNQAGLEFIHAVSTNLLHGFDQFNLQNPRTGDLHGE